MTVRDPIGSFRRAFKNSPWLVISVLAHAILILGLGLFAFRKISTPAPVDTTLVRITHPPEALPEEDDAQASSVDEVAWKTAMDAAPWLVGEAETPVPPDELFERLQPFKERVADDIRTNDEDQT
jgi:hypothetical protein